MNNKRNIVSAVAGDPVVLVLEELLCNDNLNIANESKHGLKIRTLILELSK